MTNVRFSRGSRLLRSMLVAVGVLAAARAMAQSTCPAFTDPDLCIDDFNCYRAIVTEGTERFQRIEGVQLDDQFENATVTVMRPFHLCTPTNKNEDGTIDADTHLDSYIIRRQSPAHIQRGAIRLTNELEEIRVDTIRPDMLLVPTGKSLVLPAPPTPNPSFHHVDHYKCYRVRVSRGTPKAAVDRKITIKDQFTPV